MHKVEANGPWKHADPEDYGFADAYERAVIVEKGETIAYCCLSGDRKQLCYGWFDGEGDGDEVRVDFKDNDWMSVVKVKWASMNMQIHSKVQAVPPSLGDLIWVASGKLV